MSLPQPHPDSPPEDDRSIVRYESIQGALGARRADVAPVDMQPSSSYSYQQQQYPSPVYNALPRMRTPHEHPRTPVGPPPQGYGLPYLSYPPPYAVPSGMPAPSWGTSYSHHYPESPTDASLSPELVRVDPHPHAQPQPALASDPDPDTKGKQREPPSPRVRASPDYHKLSETYRLLLDNALPYPAAATAASPSGLPSSDVLTRIYECALEGVRQFDPSDPGESPPRSPSPHARPKDDKGTPSKRQRMDAAAESQTCMGCGATSTPEWRRGPLGPRTLCNACGLVYAKLIKKRGRAEASMSIMEGAAAFATATGAVPGEFIHDYPGTSAHPPQQDPDDDRDLPHAVSSAEGDGSEDDSFEEHPQDRR